MKSQVVMNILAMKRRIQRAYSFVSKYTKDVFYVQQLFSQKSRMHNRIFFTYDYRTTIPKSFKKKRHFHKNSTNTLRSIFPYYNPTPFIHTIERTTLIHHLGMPKQLCESIEPYEPSSAPTCSFTLLEYIYIHAHERPLLNIQKRKNKRIMATTLWLK